MFGKVFKSINDFFDPKYVDTTPIPKQENIPDELMQKAKKTILASGMFEHAKDYEKIPIVKTLPSLVKLFSDLIKDNEYLQHLLRNMKFLAENEDFWIKKKPYFDYLLFSSVNQPFNSLAKNNFLSLKFFAEYINFIEGKISVKEIVSSLNFINEEKDKMDEFWLKKPMSELMKLQKWMFFEKIKKSSKGRFKMYFNDWTLKNSQIIEYTVKAIFKLFLQLDLLSKGVREEDIKELLKVNYTFGKMIQSFDPENKLKNVARLRIYRNAAFHPGVEFIYNQRENTRKMIFKDVYGKIEVDIEEFIADFRKLMVFIATINYLVANILFKAEHDGQNIFQVNYEYAKINGMKKFWIWYMKERKTKRYIKYFS
ncbi:hypothetical protein ES705_39921 [subsurface metagenome]